MILKYPNPIINSMYALMFVYAPPQEADKENLWTNVSKRLIDLNLQCVILGDLNKIQCAEDKMGGVDPYYTRFRRLTKFKNDCHFIGIPMIGNNFIWRKNRTEINNTCKRLDRTLIHLRMLD